MDELLPKAALIELEKIQHRLLLGDDVKVKASTGWLKKTLAWCDENDINLGRRASGYFYIDHQGLTSIEQRLQQLGEGSFAQLIRQLDDDRVIASQVTANEKMAKVLPTQHLVLSASTELSLRLAHQSQFGLAQPSTQLNIELEVAELDLSLFDYLIVIENRDCFNQWHSYQPPILFTRPLVVYRGHEQHHSKGCIALKTRWQRDKGNFGQVYFGDFDIDGLAIAIDSTVAYQHLLLPEFSELKTQLKPMHYDENNAFRLRELNQRCPPQWQSLLALLLNEKQGLRQQWMFDGVLDVY